MTVLSGAVIRRLGIFQPFREKTRINGMSAGLSYAGYDICVAEDIEIEENGFCLASTVEQFSMPFDVIAVVHDKSSWARQGLSVFNTVIEPGWVGFLTLELANKNRWSFWRWLLRRPRRVIRIKAGSPIAQVLFHRIEEPHGGYSGRYQNQGAGPQKALLFTEDGGCRSVA